jgi:polysaccharide deacetylase family protein (PEP-CTERM system associated)
MNILTFDIEEWYLQWAYFGNRAEVYKRYDGYLNRILDKLDERKIKATFFCVGGLARQFPEVVRLIDQRGHEVGCHSDKHTWLNKMTQTELLTDTRKAVSSLEDVLGKKITAYRAPAFTIGDNNQYALEVLAECGIEKDASIFPAVHAFGGFAKFGQREPCIIKTDGICIKEFPICTTRLFGKNIAYSGGGYFRFFPLWFVKKEMAKNDYNMTYFHIGDLVGTDRKDDATFEAYYKIPATRKNRFLREFKSNVGTKGAFDKLMKLIDSTEFVGLEQADGLVDWKKVPIIVL